MIYLTGDTHIPIDIAKLSTVSFPEQKRMTQEDYVIVLGDFGLLWHEDKTYRHWLSWLEQKPFTILWLDGNHENHDWIGRLPVTEWHGGNVHRIADNILHLMRGQIFELSGKNFFVMGGADSIDKAHRQTGISWWPQEVPSAAEGMEALDRLHAWHAAGHRIDYVLTHTCPREIVYQMFHVHSDDPTTKLLDAVNHEVIDKIEGWYFGHWHETKDFWKYHCLYNKVLRLL